MALRWCRSPYPEAVERQDVAGTAETLSLSSASSPVLDPGQAETTNAPVSVATIGQLAAIAAVLLPATGITIRLIAFSFEPRLTTATIDLAAAAPIASVTLLGLWAAALPFGLVLVAIVLARFPGALVRPRKWGWRAELPWFIFGAILLVFAPVSVLVIAPIAFEMSNRIVLRLRGRKGLAQVWPVLLPTFVAAVLIGGFGLVHLSSGYVTILKGDGVPSGSYSIVGASGSVTYLLPCRSDGTLIAINTADVESIKFYKHPPGITGEQSLFTWAVEGRPFAVGVTYSCPTR